MAGPHWWLREPRRQALTRIHSTATCFVGEKGRSDTNGGAAAHDGANSQVAIIQFYLAPSGPSHGKILLFSTTSIEQA